MGEQAGPDGTPPKAPNIIHSGWTASDFKKAAEAKVKAEQKEREERLAREGGKQVVTPFQRGNKQHTCSAAVQNTMEDTERERVGCTYKRSSYSDYHSLTIHHAHALCYMVQLLDVCVGTRCSNIGGVCHCGGTQTSRCGNYVPSRMEWL